MTKYKSKVLVNRKCIACDRKIEVKNKHSNGHDIDRNIAKGLLFSAREILQGFGMKCSPGKKELCLPCTYNTRDIRVKGDELTAAVYAFTSDIQNSDSYVKRESPSTPRSKTPVWSPSKLRYGKRAAPQTPSGVTSVNSPTMQPPLKKTLFRTPSGVSSLRTQPATRTATAQHLQSTPVTGTDITTTNTKRTLFKVPSANSSNTPSPALIDLPTSSGAQSLSVQSPKSRRSGSKQSTRFVPPTRTTTKIKPVRREAKVGRAIKYLAAGQHATGLRQLFLHSTASRKALAKVLPELVRNEVQAAAKEKGPFYQNPTKASLEGFNWDEVVRHYQATCPLLLSTLVGSLANKYSEVSLTTGRLRKRNLKPVIGSIMSQILFRRNHQNQNFCQKSNAVMMWLGGCKRMLFKNFNQLGFCSSIDTARVSLDVIRKDFDKEVKCWQQTVQTTFGTASPEQQTSATPVSGTVLPDEQTSAMHVSGTASPGEQTSTTPVSGMASPDDQTSAMPVTGPASPDEQTSATLVSGMASPDDQTSAMPVTGPASPDEQTSAMLVSGMASPDDQTSAMPVTGPASPDEQTSATLVSGMASPDEQTSATLVSGTPSTTPVRITRRSQLSRTKETVDMEIEKPNEGMGYTITFDNVNQRVVSRKQRLGEVGNRNLDMVQAYAAKERIPSLHLDDTIPSPQTIRQMDIDSILPQDIHVQTIRMELEVLVKRILTEHMVAFSTPAVKATVPSHIEHEYSRESCKKSKLVPLGVIHKNENKTGEMMDIMVYYQQYVAVKRDGTPYCIIFYGDGLSIERAWAAQYGRWNEPTAWDRLEGLQPSVQEWHLRMHILEDVYAELWTPTSSRQRGTLYDLRNRLGKSNVTGDVKHNFSHSSDFLEIVTIGYTLLAAKHVMAVCPPPQTSSDEELPDASFLTEVARSIVDMCFQEPDTQEITTHNVQEDAADSKYCVCHEELGGRWVGCSNLKCKLGLWFHLRCIGLSPKDVPVGHWYCSEFCEKQHLKDCAAGTRKKTKKPAKPPLQSLALDSKREYSRAVLFRGLFQMALRDSVRENDGPRMLAHWRFLMPHFYQWGHHKYFILGTRLLLDVDGAVSPRMAFQLTWTRAVNPKGGAGQNLEGDLQMEFFNRDYKESVLGAGGNLTDKTIARHSQMVGVGRELRGIYDAKITETATHISGPSKEYEKLHKEVTAVVEYLEDEDLFCNVPGRAHKDFTNYALFTGVKDHKKFAARFLKHKEIYARRMELRANHRPQADN